MSAMSDTSSVSSMDEEVELAFLCKLEKAHLITPILNTVNVKAKETVCPLQFRAYSNLQTCTYTYTHLIYSMSLPVRLWVDRALTGASSPL